MTLPQVSSVSNPRMSEDLEDVLYNIFDDFKHFDTDEDFPNHGGMTIRRYRYLSNVVSAPSHIYIIVDDGNDRLIFGSTTSRYSRRFVVRASSQRALDLFPMMIRLGWQFQNGTG